MSASISTGWSKLGRVPNSLAESDLCLMVMGLPEDHGPAFQPRPKIEPPQDDRVLHLRRGVHDQAMTAVAFWTHRIGNAFGAQNEHTDQRAASRSQFSTRCRDDDNKWRFPHDQ